MVAPDSGFLRSGKVRSPLRVEYTAQTTFRLPEPVSSNTKIKTQHISNMILKLTLLGQLSIGGLTFARQVKHQFSRFPGTEMQKSHL